MAGLSMYSSPQHPTIYKVSKALPARPQFHRVVATRYSVDGAADLVVFDGLDNNVRALNCRKYGSTTDT